MKCKYCNSEIDGNAKFCPYCGKEVVTGKRVGPNKKTWLWIIGVILLLVIVGGVWYFSGSVSGDKNRTFTVGDVSFRMIAVEGGTFTMGTEQEEYTFDWEKSAQPAHTVTVNSFSIGITEVSQELWQAVMGSNPSYFNGSRRPVEQVSWDDCQKFISKLNEITGENFRLPTEAEWEFAARGGNKSRGYKYAGSDEVDDVAWYGTPLSRSYSEGTFECGTKLPNELGLYDMSGNVWEWCQDWYGSYSNNSQTNPTGPSSGSNHVIRGGSCFDLNPYSHVFVRDGKMRSHRTFSIGLRLAL